MSRRPILVVGSILVPALLWLLFRAEFLSVDRSVAESPPRDGRVTQPVVVLEEASALRLASGEFHGAAHETRGQAAVLELSSGKRILRLTDFATSDGPDLRVLLIAASDAKDDATVTHSAPIELGTLKSTSGNQIYSVPAGVDLGRYRAVTIWSHSLGVNFGTAPLS